MAFTTVHTVEVGGHEYPRSAFRANFAQALHLARIINLVKLQNSKLHLLVLVLLLLRLGVGLLFTFLSSSQQTQRDIELGIVSYSIRGQRSIVFQQATTKSDALSLGWNALASFDDGFDIGNSRIRSEVQDLCTICIMEFFTSK